MAAPRLKREVMIATLEAAKKYSTANEAARSIGVPVETFRSRLRVAQAMDLSTPIAKPDPLDLPFEESWQRWMKAIGMAKDRYKGPERRKTIPKNAKRLRVVAAGDFHVPFHDRDAVADLIAREADTADVLLIGGDFGDMHAASTFTKYEHVPFREELAETTACMQALSESFKQIVYLRGSNHMDRVEKRLREALHTDLLDAVLSMTNGELSPDLVLVKRYPNVTIGDWTTPSGARVGWLTVIGDVAFSHAEKYSRVPGAAMRSVEEWLTDFSGALGLPPIRGVVQFHTHAQAMIPWKADKVLLEPGCMCATHGYQLGSKIGGRPQRVGYTVFDIIDGRLDYESIRLRWMNRPE